MNREEQHAGSYSGSSSQLEAQLERTTADLIEPRNALVRERIYRKKSEDELERRIALENLLTTLSTEFISLKPEEIDQGVERALEHLGRFTCDDRSWVIIFHQKTMDNTHEWCAPGVPSSRLPFADVPVTLLPHHEEILRGEVVYFPCVAHLPPDDRLLLESVGDKSVVVVPILFRGTVIGCLGFDSVQQEKSWSADIIVLLNTVGEMFAHVLSRKLVEEELQESQQALSTLMSNLPGMAFRLDDDTNGTFEFASEGCLELTGFEQERLLRSDGLSHMRLIHPDDRDAVRRLIRDALDDLKPYQSTHRLMTASGDTRWVYEHGRGVKYPHRKAAVLEGFCIDANDRVLALHTLETRVHERTRELERRCAVAEGLRDIVEALNDTHALVGALDQVVEQSSHLMSTSAVAVYSHQPVRMWMTIEAARGLRPDCSVGTHFLLPREAEMAVTTQCEPLVISDMAGEPHENELVRQIRRIHAQSMRGAIRALLLVPLTLGDETYGALALYYDTPTAFSCEDVELATILGQHATLVIEDARLRADAERSGVAQERSRIAGDLHDSVTQTVFSASMITEALPNLLLRNPPEAKRQLEQLSSLTRQVLSEMRTLLMELCPLPISDVPTDELFGRLAHTSMARAGLPVRLRMPGHLRLPSDVRVGLFKIAQEALNNVARHSDAAHASVVIEDVHGCVILKVSDDGIGFASGRVSPGHFGLTIMRERAQAIGATLGIEPGPQGGTDVVVQWPRRTPTSVQGP